MTERFAKACKKGCDFLIAVQGHDFETIEAGVDSYKECPNCGSELEKCFMYKDSVTGNIKISAENRGENQ